MKKLIALIVSLCMLVGMLPAVAETAAEAPATAPADAEKVDMNHLIDQLLNDVNNAVSRVDVEAAEKAGATPESSKGNVFTVLVNVLNNIAETKAKRGEENEDLNKLLAILNDREATKDMDEKDLDGLASLLLLGIIADADERAAKQEEEADAAISIALANGILKEIYDACQANETLAAAVKATDSKLYDMLLANNERFKSYVEKNGALTVADLEENEKNYAAFEAEIKKVEDYLKGTEGPKQGALDLLALLHAAMDDIHAAIDGHTHENAEEVDHYSLVGEMLSDLMEAISKVNLDDVKSKAGDSFDISGSVYAVLEKVVNNIMADEVIKEKEADDKMALILEMIGKLAEQDVTEEEAEAVFALLAAADEKIEEAKEIDPEVDFLRSSHIMKATYDTMMENDVIKAAIETTGSRLPEMLVNSGEKLKNYLQKNKTLHKVEDVDEAPFIAFEAEFAKVRDHIEGLEDGTVGKAKALGVLNLLHEYVDDIHEAVDGHTHEDVEKQAAAFTAGAAFGKSLQEIEDAFGRADFEVDQEHTHGPVTFTELEYENASLDGMHADEHYLFVEDKLVAFTICFKDGAVTFDSVVADLAKMYGEAKELDQTVLANGIYAVDDDGKIEGKAVAITVGDMLIVIAEDKDEVEVTYLDLTAAYILANA